MIGVAVLASSCSDWLDPKPLSFYTPEISFADYNGLKTGTDILNRDVRYFDFYPTSGSADPCILSEYFFSDISCLLYTSGKGSRLMDKDTGVTVYEEAIARIVTAQQPHCLKMCIRDRIYTISFVEIHIVFAQPVHGG